MQNMSIFQMVHQVLGEAKEKVAADKAANSAGQTKTAAATPASVPSIEGSIPTERLLKLADALDYVSTNIHSVADDRSPHEKLAELAAIQEGLMKAAMEGGDSAHQTQQANPDSVPDKTVSLDDSGTGVGQGNAIPSEQTDTPGTSMDAGESGSALPANTPDKTTTPNEKANPQDASNAMETNKGMLQSDLPEDLLKQPGGDLETGSPSIKTSAAHRILYKVTGRDARDAKEKVASLKRAHILLQKAAQSGIPQDVAEGMILMAMPKLAEDAINPAQISGDSKPILQSDPGTPSPLSQGSEAGVNTPRECAPTGGEGGGREALSSNVAAINVTKGQAKRQNKGALSELLSEPMQSSRTDKVLSESLDNADSAGVKISAAREMVRKFMSASPHNARMVAELVKAAEGEAAGDAAPPSEAQPPSGEMVPPEGGIDPAALEAAQADVTPEELAAAEAMLAEGTPEGGDVVKTEQGPVGATGVAPTALAASPMAGGAPGGVPGGGAMMG